MVGSLVAVAALAGSMAGSAASGNDNGLAASLASSAPTATSSALGSGASVDAKVVKQVAAHGHTTFWVVLREQADLSAARGMRASPRGRFVYDSLTSTADRTQPPLKAWLRQRHIPFKSFWILNALRVTAGSSARHALAARPEVEKILPDVVFRIPKVTPGQGLSTPGTVEWGLTNINAPQVWTNFNDRGEGIVVGSIDTGVLYTHTALVMKYRGRNTNGTFNHNYNWNDPTGVCGSLTPCDNHGHGTHTVGTMVGDDGDPGPNQVGVAPHAKWIASKGCASNSCDTAALLASGQWMLAPTNTSGQNPDPNLRPDIVNNSWGNSNGGDTFYQAIVQSWVSSGIFPVFSSGNTGPGCGTVGSPGSYPESYAVGAYDINNVIASFSSRGPSPLGGIIKPNIAGPGVNVRSSFNDGSYAALNGTSMAAPHLAGTVALIWSAAPGFRRNIAATRAVLNQTAIDTDGTCGGTTQNNNSFGEGRLDALAAVTQAVGGPSASTTSAATRHRLEAAAVGRSRSPTPGRHPYPSNCVVSGLTGTITDVDLSINGFSHTYSDDVDIMLAHPTPTTNATVMSDAGGANGSVNLNLVLDDEAANQLPDATAISSGSWRPANWPAASDGFLAPAPTQSANVNLSTFDGLAPNGTWTLWVQDDLGGDMGSINSWDLTITTSGGPPRRRHHHHHHRHLRHRHLRHLHLRRHHLHHLRRHRHRLEAAAVGQSRSPTPGRPRLTRRTASSPG